MIIKQSRTIKVKIESCFGREEVNGGNESRRRQMLAEGDEGSCYKLGQSSCMIRPSLLNHCYTWL